MKLLDHCRPERFLGRFLGCYFIVVMVSCLTGGLAEVLAQDGTQTNSQLPTDPFADSEVFITSDKRSETDPPHAIYVTPPEERNKKVSVTVQDAPLPGVLRYLTEETGRSFAAHSSLTSVLVTVDQKEQKWTKILETLVFQYDLQVESVGTIIKLSKVITEESHKEASEIFLLLFKVFLGCFVLSATILIVRVVLLGGRRRQASGARW
jgi:hypothetical protein